MQMLNTSVLRTCCFLALLFSWTFGLNAYAEGGKESGNGAYEKLEPFTVNLVGLKQMIQVSLTLKLAKPEAGEKVKLYMPVIRHEMIILLSGKTAEQIGKSEGKQRLIAETKAAVNKAIELDAKEGIADVLFEQIIIQ